MSNEIIPGKTTAQELFSKGWTKGHTSKEQGYMSRKNKEDNGVVEIAGPGARKGQYFYRLPNYESTRFGIIRQYLVPPQS